MGEERLFVYGTLRPAALSQAPAYIQRAVSNSARPIGAGSVAGALYWIAWYPGLVESADGRVVGDVLALDPVLLAKLDVYEGHEYARRRVRVELDDGGELEAWAYFYLSVAALGQRIESGDFLLEAPPEVACVDYLHLRPGDAPPDRAGSTRFKSVIAIEADVTQEWRANVAAWIVRAGCLYAMTWGRDCAAWHDEIDWASIEMFNHDVPDENHVMTTWHENEPLEDVMGFAAFSAFHPTVELMQTLIIDISPIARRAEMLDRYASALKY